MFGKIPRPFLRWLRFFGRREEEFEACLEAILRASRPSARKFNKAFKDEAVNHWPSSGKSAATVAREPGIGEGRLYAWRQMLLPPAPNLP